MTILPKKKAGGGGISETESDHSSAYQMSLGANQGSEELLYPVNPDRGWVGRGENASSPSHWSANANVSREEKRHSSPLHPADFEDSLDGVPSAKRARPTHPSRHGRARSKPYVPTPSSSRVEASVPLEEEEEDDTGYNSEDEYSHVGATLTEEEWLEKDRSFERAMRLKGYSIKLMGEDGACLFRAVADQLYGDQEMHSCVRAQCMDYIESNRDYFEQYVTEDFIEYIRRKRIIQVHGNHLEIQALSELYNRPIHVFCYSSEPINICEPVNRSNNEVSIPIRLSYHRDSHYNSLIDPNCTAIGIGLGLPGVKAGLNKADLHAVLAQNENSLTEKQMLEDKINFTDWEATNEVIEEQVARESYQLWLQEQEKARNKATRNPPAATVTSGQMSPRGGSGGSSSPRPRGHASPRPSSGAGQTSPRPQSAGGASSPRPPSSSGHSSPKAGSSSQSLAEESTSTSSPKPGCSNSCNHSTVVDHGLGPSFQLRETATFLNGLPPDVFGLEEWGGEDSVLHQVLAASQQEYLDSLKSKNKEKEQD